MITLQGKGALIVGARRVGAVLARRMAREGLNIAIGYRSSAAEAEALHDSVAATGATVCTIQGDLSHEADVQAMVEQAVAELGDLSFVVNLASDYPRAPLPLLDSVAWDRAMSTAKGSYLLALHAARAMLLNPGPTRGHIVLFGDWAAGETPYREYLPYLTAKAAVQFMTRAFAAELASHGILVNVLAPGPTMRPADITEAEWHDDILAQAPLRRESSADELGRVPHHAAQERDHHRRDHPRRRRPAPGRAGRAGIGRQHTIRPSTGSGRTGRTRDRRS